MQFNPLTDHGWRGASLLTHLLDAMALTAKRKGFSITKYDTYETTIAIIKKLAEIILEI